MSVFSEKNIELSKCKTVDFLQIRHFFTAVMRKASGESCAKQGTYCMSKLFDAIGKLQCDFKPCTITVIKMSLKYSPM